MKPSLLWFVLFLGFVVGLMVFSSRQQRRISFLEQECARLRQQVQIQSRGGGR